MTTIDLVKLIVTILTSSVASSLAAYVGVRIGLRKYMREKAFDARREWYEHATRELIKYVGSLRVYIGALRREATREALDRYLDELIASAESMVPVLNLAYLYAKPRTVDAVLRLFKVNELLVAGAFSKEGHGESSLLGSLARAELFARTVAYDLAIEFREHLGLERLPQELVPTLALDERK
jgi:hypothetical protein